MELEKWRAAFHEAGHATLAYLTGVYEIKEIDIRHEETGFAYVFYPKNDGLIGARWLDNKKADIDHAWERSIICAAGMEAERRYLSRCNLPIDAKSLEESASGDRVDVQRLLGDDKWEDACMRAAQYLDDPRIWNVVEAIAKAAFHRGVLVGHQADDLLHCACVENDLPPWLILK